MSIQHIPTFKVNFPGGQQKNICEGTTLLEICKEYAPDNDFPVIGAKVDNNMKELSFRIDKDCKVEFVTLNDKDGILMYRRSLCFILIKAVNDIFPEKKVVISHSISKGIYCEIKGENEISNDDVVLIEAKMRELVRHEIPFIKKVIPTEEAKEKFKNSDRMDKYYVVEHRKKQHVTIYNCDGYEDYLYGYMVPHTGYIKKFALKYYAKGVVLMFPDESSGWEIPEFKEHKKIFSIFSEYKRWGYILGVDNIGSLNGIIKNGKIGDFIRISEALHEKKIAQIADMITNNDHRKKVVLISGPSSSGKTTFANRLAIQLRVNCMKVVNISLDDYFVDREHTPKDIYGNYDFEALEAIDLELFNDNLAKLIAGEEVEIPIFNFTKGCRETVGRKLKINDEQILIIEGIHGLNERLTWLIPKEFKFKVYVSALTSMNIDNHNRIATTDTRILRRMVRDYRSRGCDAINTIRRWDSVRRGEEKNIFPFQEEADVMFNSFLIFELSVLRAAVEPLLSGIDNTYPEYSEAKRLIEFLGYFLPIDHKDIPSNSIIREFIGGSCFYKD